MSRSKKGSKGPGYEYWGKRGNGYNNGGRIPGKFNKDVTHKIERKDAKKNIEKEKE